MRVSLASAARLRACDEVELRDRSALSPRSDAGQASVPRTSTACLALSPWRKVAEEVRRDRDGEAPHEDQGGLRAETASRTTVRGRRNSGARRARGGRK